MLQLSTQSEDRLLGQSQVPFTDTITLKKETKFSDKDTILLSQHFA